MITQKQIEQGIKTLLDAYEVTLPETRERTSITNKLNVARQNLEYIKTGASEDLIKIQLNKLIKKRTSIDEGFKEWQKSQTENFKNPLTTYQSQMKRSVITKQIKNLKYLLGD